MARTLMLYPEALDMLEDQFPDLLSLFNDNGGYPDGPAWLPSEVVDDDTARYIVQEGFGEFIDTHWMTDAGLADILHITDVLTLAEATDDWEAFRNAVDDRLHTWAHYGAYGSLDSFWVVAYHSR